MLQRRWFNAMEFVGSAERIARTDRPTTSAQSATTDENAAAELAKRLQDPIANLISVPLKLNCDTSIGPAGGPDWELSFTATFLFQK